MSIQSVNVNGIAVIEVRQGPAGIRGVPGPNQVTIATASDGTALLDVEDLIADTATISETLTAPHIHGNLAGSVYAHVRAGENLAKGDPVYVSGSHGSGATLIPIVSKADAADSAKMPAIGIMDAAVAANATGHMVITGSVTEFNTLGMTVNAELYVAEGGGLSTIQPTENIQPVGRVERVNSSNGAFIVKVNGLSSIGETSDSAEKLTRYGTRGELVATTDVGSAAYFENTGTAPGIEARTTTGTDHARFGPASSSDATYFERLKGAVAWLRGAFRARIHPPDMLTATRTYTLPDATGNVMLDSTLVSTLGTVSGAVTAGGNWGFSSTTRPTSAGTGTPAATSLITRADGDALFPKVYLAVAGQDEDATNTATLQNSQYCKVNLPEVGTYLIETSEQVISSAWATAGAKSSLFAPSGSTGFGAGAQSTRAAASFLNQTFAYNNNWIAQQVILAPSTSSWVMRVVYLIITQPGLVGINFSQNTAVAGEYARLQKTSWIRATKIS